ncbi:MAG: hypothetical protein ACRDQA_10035, partial [Nocardioidaceae bacterium]
MPTPTDTGPVVALLERTSSAHRPDAECARLRPPPTTSPAAPTGNGRDVIGWDAAPEKLTRRVRIAPAHRESLR